MSCGISPSFPGLFPTRGQVTHALLTRSPLYLGLLPFALDLHVLGTPPALILSQDQTLQLNLRAPDRRLRSDRNPFVTEESIWSAGRTYLERGCTLLSFQRATPF